HRCAMARGDAALQSLDHLEPPVLAVPAEALQRLLSAAAQVMQTSYRRITSPSEPSEHQSTCEAFLASRRCMPCPTSRALSALTAFPSMREVLCSAGKTRR